MDAQLRAGDRERDRGQQDGKELEIGVGAREHAAS
jgi:hypothetical protein